MFNTNENTNRHILYILLFCLLRNNNIRRKAYVNVIDIFLPKAKVGNRPGALKCCDFSSNMVDGYRLLLKAHNICVPYFLSFQTLPAGPKCNFTSRTVLIQSLSKNSCGVKKSVCLRIAGMNRILP